MEGMFRLRLIQPGTFNGLLKLRTLYIKQAPNLRSVPGGVFESFLPSFKILRIVHSGLEIIPRIRHLNPEAIFFMVDFDSNRIKTIATGTVEIKAEKMHLDYNTIEDVDDGAFNGSHIYELSLKGNRELQRMGQKSFVGLRNLRRLDLSQTSIRSLPTMGLEGLEVLRVTETFTLKEFPSVFHFREIIEAHLTYSYHCCAFQFPHRQDADEHFEIPPTDYGTHCSGSPMTTSEQPNTGTRKHGRDVGVFGKVVFTVAPPLDDAGYETYYNQTSDWTSLLQSERVDLPKEFRNKSHWKLDEEKNWEKIAGVFHSTPLRQPPSLLKAFCGDFASSEEAYGHVTCDPSPDAFNPCEDVMGNWPLRVCVWVVAIAATVGNLAVMGVLMASARMTVSKYLMCHLAFADFCMGLYLLIIACIDVHTKGVYFNHAIYWQHGAGCQVAGFLTVFASELSIFTLTVITLERWYAITYAIHLNRRLQLGTAARVMAAGWLYAIAIACLPLFGISSYVRTSICLPMEHQSLADITYVTCLLTLNGFAFMLVCGCYAKMYLSIKSSRGNSYTTTRAARSDASVAKRMALLVFTDFACWAPITFFGLTAVAGYPLIDLTKSKILLVFFYPLNSCANPFLYAILTKQYRRDVCSLISRFRKERAKIPRRTTFTTNPSNETKRSLLLHLRDNSKSSTSNNAEFSTKLPRNNSFGGKSQEVSAHQQQHRFLKGFDEPLKGMKTRESTKPEGNSNQVFRRGSPHPIKSSYTKLSPQNAQQEVVLYRALAEASSGECTPVWCTKSSLQSNAPNQAAKNSDTRL